MEVISNQTRLRNFSKSTEVSLVEAPSNVPANSLGQKKDHLRASLFHAYFLYIQKNFPTVTPGQLLEGTGVTIEHLRNENAWVSISFERAFMRNVRKYISAEICYEVGKTGTSREVLGGTAYYITRYVLNLEQLFLGVARLTHQYNKLIKLEVLESTGSGYIALRLTPIFEGLTPTEQKELTEALPDILENTRGYYEHASIEKKSAKTYVQIIPDQDSESLCYKVIIQYPIEKRRVVYTAYITVSVLVGYAVGSYYPDGHWSPYLGAFLGVGTALFLSLRRTLSLEYLAEEGQRQLTKIDEQFHDLNKARTQLERELKQTELVKRSTEGLVGARSLNSILEDCCYNLTNLLGYDRCFIMLEDTSSAALQVRATSGASPELTDTLKKFSLSVKIENDDPTKFSNVYLRGTSLLIKDVKGHLNKLTDPMSRYLLEYSDSVSFACVTIKTESQRLGLLVADCNRAQKQLSEQDVDLLATVANQVALAIEREGYHQQAQRLSAAYSRFVPFQLIKLLGYDSVLDIKLGDSVEKDLAVLFCDIRDFTKLCENMSPEDILKFLNSYLAHVSPSVNKFNGFIDKFIGDCIMAIFPNSDLATKAALDIQSAIHDYNVSKRLGRREPIRVGIGIHSGRNIFGPIGYDNKLELTVLSDNVNLASRIGNLTKDLGAGILLSGQSVRDLSPDLLERLVYLGQTTVKGKSSRVRVFEVLEAVPQTYPTHWPHEIACKVYFEQMQNALAQKKLCAPVLQEAFTLLDLGNEKAAGAKLKEVLKAIPHHKAATYHLSRLPSFERRRSA